FLAVRPPPPSTLFPYTTLFRSAANAAGRGRTHPEHGAAAPVHARRAAREAQTRRRARDRLRVPDWLPASGRRENRRKPYLSAVRDRKSTRLNSSHDQISYAVFC